MKHNIHHLAILPRERAKEQGNSIALHQRSDKTGKWLPVTWSQLSDFVDVTACALLSEDVQINENMAVFTQNMIRGIVTDFAAYSVKAVTIPLYATSSESQVQYIVNDAKIRIMFVGQQQQYNVAMNAAPLCPTLHKIIIYDPEVIRRPNDTISVYWSDFVRDKKTDDRMKEVERRREERSDADTANILYTSGTTGEPKGVILTHGGFLAQFHVHCETLPQLSMKNQTSMNFLPLTHVFEKAWTFLCMETGNIQVYVNTDPKVITRSIKEVHPTMMCAVPRFWEKVYDGVQAKIAAMSPLMQSMVKDAIKVGHEYWLETKAAGKQPSLALTMKYKMYEKTIFHILKKAIGIENGTLFPTAGAAIPNTIEEFIHSVGIPMVAGYGLTETTATVTCDQGDVFSIGSAGRILKSQQVKIGPNNEVLVKGPNVTPGYYNKPEANKAAFDEEGFFRTGDAGYIKDGELFLTDRIKDLYKTSNGKYIAPQLIEGRLCVDKFIDQISIIADQRKFVSALIIPAYEELEHYAKANNIKYSNRAELVKNEQIHHMIEHRIETLSQGLAGYEKVKKFTLLPEPFTMERGELTNTLKICRPVLLKNYAEEIAEMYKE